jgi:hypothetical protein
MSQYKFGCGSQQVPAALITTVDQKSSNEEDSCPVIP